MDIRGQEALQQSHVGVAFHREDDNTYEAVYLRPFNFRAQDPARKQHAVQDISLPKSDFQDLRDQFPEEFENPVDASIVPTDWVKLRVVIEGSKVQIHVGSAKELAATSRISSSRRRNSGCVQLVHAAVPVNVTLQPCS